MDSRRFLFGYLLLTALVAGCGSTSGPERVTVQGEVTYKGQAVSQGRIRFIPLPDYEVPMAGGYVADGRYRIEFKGGVPVGKYRVEITAPVVDPKYAHLQGKNGDVENDLPKIESLPPKFNRKSTLILEVSAGSAAITHDFHLTD